MQKIQARYYTKGRVRPVRLIVCHSMEAPEKPTTAEAVARWFATSSPRTSTHVNVDNNSMVRSVDDGDTAWCAPNANADGLHVELTGYARQTRTEWLDAFSRATLANAAKVVARWCKKYKIPVRKLTPSEVAAGKKGICGHVDVTRAYPGTGDHTDPGKHFPWDVFLSMVRAELGDKPAAPPRFTRVLVYTKGKAFLRGADVEAFQARLADHGIDVEVDGVYGPATVKGTSALQRRLGFIVTGTVDKATWKAAFAKAA
ncbi:N-acetylmuramoyl-L-alanine amidase [Planomonospora sp. ID82291]|uniref:peptidoglycan recognition protein family protein n=1 Tax=Planomonospora sp. ID82291 TaxID=2738136 RepID=UPI0018C44976|nr:N-acetylmuramoyl-L-alanine amidase [Planomonospora sp. ID82291]MBG0818315.1 N-acetylmuramoyl-L-alanine amidase [Planomonospora sp. ID82291]